MMETNSVYGECVLEAMDAGIPTNFAGNTKMLNRETKPCKR